MNEMKGGEREPGRAQWERLLVVVVSVALVGTVIVSALVLSTGPEPARAQPVVAAVPEITPADVFVRPPRPSGDNRSAIIPIEIEMINIGKGQSGNLLVWCGAFDHEQPNLLLDDFSTSSLRTMSDYSVTGRITASGRPGSIVRLAGELELPPGEYDLRLRIYEDGGNRTLVSGLIRMIVDKDSVKVPDPFSPGGSGGRSVSPPVPEKSASKGLPGFEALGALAALGAVLALVAVARRRA
ncbi:MAG: hypothetical protein FJ149_10615 [Euryarchaeota archaeon]|nr:hypothetical protein [Euryarchaeota archaeon]